MITYGGLHFSATLLSSTTMDITWYGKIVHICLLYSPFFSCFHLLRSIMIIGLKFFNHCHISYPQVVCWQDRLFCNLKQMYKNTNLLKITTLVGVIKIEVQITTNYYWGTVNNSASVRVHLGIILIKMKMMFM